MTTWMPDGVTRCLRLRDAADDSRVLGVDDLAHVFGRVDDELASAAWSWIDGVTLEPVPESAVEGALVSGDGWRVRLPLVRRLLGRKVTLALLSAMGAIPPPKVLHRVPERLLADLPDDAYVTPLDVMRVTGCKRRTAYSHLTKARGGRPGRTTVREWTAYAGGRWGAGGDD